MNLAVLPSLSESNIICILELSKLVWAYDILTLYQCKNKNCSITTVEYVREKMNWWNYFPTLLFVCLR